MWAHISPSFLNPWTDSIWFQYSTPAHHNFLMADLSAADAARDQSVTKVTMVEQTCAWCRWLKHITSIGINSNSFLNEFHCILSGLAQTILSGCFSAEWFNMTKSESIHTTMDHVASWHHPSRLTTGQTQDMTVFTNLQSFYTINLNVTTTLIQPKSPKRKSQHPFSCDFIN